MLSFKTGFNSKIKTNLRKKDFVKKIKLKKKNEIKRKINKTKTQQNDIFCKILNSKVVVFDS